MKSHIIAFFITVSLLLVIVSCAYAYKRKERSFNYEQIRQNRIAKAEVFSFTLPQSIFKQNVSQKSNKVPF